jgi:hypothetical protein
LSKNWGKTAKRSENGWNKHPKAPGKRQLVLNNKHFEGLPTSGQHQVLRPMPKLVPNSTPEVYQRDLSVYEQFLDEAVAVR